MTGRWANCLQPTCLWEEDSRLDIDWLQLAVIPTGHRTCSAPASIWTRDEVHSISQPNHIGFSGNHYYPTTPDLIHLPDLLVTLTHQVCDLLLTMRLQRQCVPQAMPLVPTVRRRPTVSFRCDSKVTGANGHTSTDTISKPFLHPAFRRYHPSQDTPPALHTPAPKPA